ncbi:putative leader peptide [Actinoplanes subtropicus]
MYRSTRLTKRRFVDLLRVSSSTC